MSEMANPSPFRRESSMAALRSWRDEYGQAPTRRQCAYRQNHLSSVGADLLQGLQEPDSDRVWGGSCRAFKEGFTLCTARHARVHRR
jgi:hypothetical protein